MGLLILIIIDSKKNNINWDIALFAIVELIIELCIIF